jgi:signal transduction histidine kinase
MSAKKRLKYIVILIVGLGIIFFNLINYYASMQFVISQLESRAEDDISRIVETSQRNNSFDFISEYSTFKVEVIDYSYELIQSNSVDKTSFFSSDVFEAKKDGVATAFKQENRELPLEFIYSKRVNLFNDNFIIRCTYQVQNFGLYKVKLINSIIISIVLSALFIYLLVISIKRQYKKPLKKLANYTSKVAPTAKEKIKIDTNDSTINSIVNEFNNLIDNYNSLIDHNNRRLSLINSFLSNINTGVLTFDSKGDVLLMNNKVESLLGIKRNQVFLSDPLNNKYFRKLLNFASEIAENRENIIFHIKIDDEKTVEIEGRAFFNKYSPHDYLGVVFMIRDVTKLRELETVQREFVSNVSHELKTPLAVISGYTQTLINDEDILNDELRKSCLNSIYKESKKLSYLITELLDISRLIENRGFGESENFNPFTLVSKSLNSFRNRAKNKNIIIVTNVTSDEDVIINNKPLFFLQVLNNLVDNAIKYSPVDSKISINQSVDDGIYNIKITDRGYGIPKEDLAYIFNRFYRVEKSRNSEIAGSGLGLAIAKEMVSKLGGKIEVDSTINEGSTFSIAIPIQRKNNET